MRIFILILLFVALGNVGCTDAVDTFPAHMQELKVYTPAHSEDSERSFRTGDQISLYAVRYKSGVPGTLGEVSDCMNACYTYTSTGWEAAPGNEIFLDETLIDLYAFSPYDSEMSRAPEKMDLSAYPLDVSGNQAEKDTDFLWTKALSISQSSFFVALPFEHLMSRIVINLKYPAIDTIVPAISLHNLKTNCSINLRTGGVTTGDQSKVILPTLQPTPSTGYNQTFEALLPPQTMRSGTPLFMVEYQEDAWAYNLSQQVAFESVASYTFNLVIDAQTFTGAKASHSVSPTRTKR